MAKIFNWLLFSTSLLIIAAHGGCEAHPANTAPQAWNAEQTQQEAKDRIAWMKRMDVVEAEAAERDAKAAKEFETADLANWHPPYEPVE
jgi:hypothetical protein